MMENWVYVVVATVFALGYWIGHRKGKLDGQREMLFQQQKIEATRMWTEAISKYMGGQDAKN